MSLKSAQKKRNLKNEKRISELEKQNSKLKGEMELCSSRIEVMEDRHPKFVKQNDQWRRPLAWSMGNRHGNEATDEIKLPCRFFKGRPDTTAYARPVARAWKASFTEKHASSAAGGVEHKLELSSAVEEKVREYVSRNYDKLIELMNNR